MGSFGWQEALLVLLLVFLIFGGSRLPQLGRGVGEALRNFKKGIRGETGDDIVRENEKD